MTSQLGDRTIHATLIVDDGKELSQVTPTIAVGGGSVTELSKEHPVHYHKLSYGAKIPEVSASAENADVNVIQANESNGMRASIYVQPKDGGQLQTYAVQFLVDSPQIESLSLRVDQATSLKEDQTVKMTVLARYQDGTEAVLPTDKVTFSSQGEGGVSVNKEC